MHLVTHAEVAIPAGAVTLPGEFARPEDARGLVVFAHGSGSSRHSPRNGFVAEALREAGQATLLFDLLAEDEEPQGSYRRDLRFDIPLLAERLGAAIGWCRSRGETGGMPIGLFGASTGAAAALIAAADRPAEVAAVVARGGRPDLAEDALARVRAPALLIVGGADREVLDLNRAAAARMSTESALEVVEGASHLFEERGALDEVARLAAGWFDRHLGN